MNKFSLTTFFTIAVTQALNFHHYEIQQNVIIQLNIDPIWLIASFKKPNNVFCLAECNSKHFCLSVFFITDKTTSNYNCFLYRKYFDSTEITSANGSELFSKDCK